MKVTGTHFNYYQVCKRKLWLFANGITMEHTSDLVYEGKLIHEESYPRRSAKYEEVDTGNKIIHEIKKSDKIERAHEWQLKYYIYIFEQNGMKGVTGILEYPVLRKKDLIYLSDIDREMICEMEHDILQIIESDSCPSLEKKRVCKNCSYLDFCYSGEEEE